LTALIQKEIPAAEFNEIAVEGKVSMVETFPTAICCGLFPEIYPVKYKVKHKTPYEESKRQLIRILKRLEKIEKIEGRVHGLVDKLNVSHLEITKKTHKHIEDQLDAFLSAYSLFTIYKGYANQKSFGDYMNGFITIPIIDIEHGPLPTQAITKNIVYEAGGAEFIDSIEDLWTELNQLHSSNSPYFKERFDAFTFNMRKNSLVQSGKDLMIVLAKDKSDHEVIGYSIASISKSDVGEIDSIFIKPDYRGCKIGDELMGQPLSWFKKRNISKVTLGVAVGNEDVLPFYEKFGFYPKVMILEQK